MEAELFVSQTIYYHLKAADGIERLEQAVLKCFGSFFPKGIDGNEYSQTTASGSRDGLFKFKLEIVFDERVDHRKVRRNSSFNPALDLLKDFGGILNQAIGNTLSPLSLIVTVEIKMVAGNQIYDHLYYDEKAILEKGQLKIIQNM